jgi:DNA-binding response OmpR family regulator
MVEQDKISELKAAGADDFMHKPFNVDRLLDRVCDLLEIERAVAS